MAVTSGFFNSVAGDRMYNADDINEFLEGMITEGVLSPVGDAFNVTAPGGMSVTVGTGKAWFLRTWINNSTPKAIPLSAANGSFARYDVVVLRFDKDNRQNSIAVLEGTPAPSPTVPALTDIANFKEVALAVVYVGAGVSSIVTANIDDKIGLAATPYCVGLLSQANVGDAFDQWYGEFQTWMAQIDLDLDAIDTGSVFNELDTIRGMSRHNKNLIINGDMRINKNPLVNYVDGYTGVTDIYVGVKDRWAWELNNAGTWWIGTGLNGALKANCTAAQPTLAATSYFRLTQYIEASRMAVMHSDNPDRQPLTLSFKYRSNISGGRVVVELHDLYNDAISGHEFENETTDSIQNVQFQIPARNAQFDWTNDPGYAVYFWIAAGSNYTSGSWPLDTWHTRVDADRCSPTNNGADTINNYVEFSDVQLEVGTSKTRFNTLPHNEALRECQRYYERTYKRTIATAISTSQLVYEIHWETPKRAQPTITLAASSGYVIADSNAFTSVAIWDQPSTPSAERELVTTMLVSTVTTANLVVGQSYPIVVVNLDANAELYPS
jgi:hypothetical protein